MIVHSGFTPRTYSLQDDAEMQVQRQRLFGAGSVDALKALPLEELMEIAKRDVMATPAPAQRLDGFDDLITGTAARDSDDD